MNFKIGMLVMLVGMVILGVIWLNQ